MLDMDKEQNGTVVNDTLGCPVCGRPLKKDDLVDVKSVVEENLYDMGGVRIVDSHVP